MKYVEAQIHLQTETSHSPNKDWTNNEDKLPITAREIILDYLYGPDIISHKGLHKRWKEGSESEKATWWWKKSSKEKKTEDAKIAFENEEVVMSYGLQDPLRS